MKNNNEKKCVFCKGERFPYHAKVGLDTTEAIVYEDKNVFITADLSPLMIGHFLIVTQDHNNSFANTGLEVLKSLRCGIEFLIDFVYESKSFTFFEHGSVIPNKGGSSIDHAHVHVMPFDIGMAEHVSKDNKFINKSNYAESLHLSYKSGQPYLWIGNQSESFLYEVEEAESQYLRRLTKEIIGGKSDYNWKYAYQKSDSIEMYKKTIELCYKNRR